MLQRMASPPGTLYTTTSPLGRTDSQYPDQGLEVVFEGLRPLSRASPSVRPHVCFCSDNRRRLGRVFSEIFDTVSDEAGDEYDVYHADDYHSDDQRLSDDLVPRVLAVVLALGSARRPDVVVDAAAATVHALGVVHCRRTIVDDLRAPTHHSH